MNIIVSNSLDVPLYIQIKEQIKEAILNSYHPFETLQTMSM